MIMYEVTTSILVYVDEEENESFSNTNSDSVLMRKFIENAKNDIIINDVLEIKKCNDNGCKGCTLNCEDKK